jgi:DNA repair photolyase
MQELARRAGCTVYISVPTVDEDAWASLEPGTAHPLQRLRAVRQLKDAGIDVGVLMNPIVPGISSHPAQLERTVKAVADHGAGFVGTNVMFLEGGTREHFMNFLSREYPHLVDGYRRLYTRKYAPDAYRQTIRSTIEKLAQKHGVANERPEPPPQTGSAAQRRFEW